MYLDLTHPDAPVFMALPVTGGKPEPIGYPERGTFNTGIAVNSRTGLVTYVRLRRADADIGWLRIARR